MATLNYAFKELSCKIVYYGCGLCGKTTNLQFIHTTVPQKFRGELVSLATEQDRTLFFDFLPLDLGQVKGFKTKFQLYTVPGQVYYNATRKLVLRGVDGIVFVVDSQRDRLQENIDSLKNLQDNLAEYGYRLEEIPWILQYNKRDLPEVMTLEEMQRIFNPTGEVPFIEAVATTGVGVRETLKGISGLVIRHLNQEQTRLGSETPAATAQAPAPPAAAPAPAAAAVAPSAPPPPEAPPAPKAQEPPKPKVRVESVRDEVPGETPPEAPKRPEAPRLESRQKCDIRWRAFRVGSGSLTLAMRDNADGHGDYELGASLSFLLVKKEWKRALEFRTRESRIFEGEDVAFFRLESRGGDEGPVLTLWVKDAIDRQMFLYYDGFGGPVRVMPEGKASMP